MSGCRAERPAGFGLGAALLLSIILPAAAQTGAPTPLIPPPGAVQGPAPAAPATTPPDGSGAAPGPTGIEAAPLAELVNDGIGPLEGPVSLGSDLWRGTSRSLAETLIPQIPGTESSTARALTHRLLLTSARPPEGAGAGDLFDLRAERLLARGSAGDAAALLSMKPAGRMDAGSRAHLADLFLLAGQVDRACGLAERHDALAADLSGDRLRIFCALRRGDRDGAYLLFDLLREQESLDRAFEAALAIADGGTGIALPEDARPTPLLLSMLAEGKGAPPLGWMRTAEPTHLPRLLARPGGGVTRVLAAERAARLGLVDPAVLGSAYQSLDIPATERKAAAAGPPETARRRAALHQAIVQAADPILRARLVHLALGLPRTDSLRSATARLHAQFLRTLSPGPDVAGYAPDFARALFLAGDGASARRWVTLARANAADPGVAASLPGLALLSALAGESEPAWSAAARRFLEQPAPTPEGARLAAAARLIQVSGGALPQGAAPAGGFFDPGLGLALRNAASARRVGETVLFALIALGDRGPGSSDPGALAEALTALRRIGLEEDARALAIEAAIANGA